MTKSHNKSEYTLTFINAPQLTRGSVGLLEKNANAAIKYLADNNRYDVVLRPHPAESVEAWKFYLDGIPNAEDAFPRDSSEWNDNDSDGIGDNSDPDDDNDGFNDSEDLFPFDSLRYSEHAPQFTFMGLNQSVLGRAAS